MASSQKLRRHRRTAATKGFSPKEIAALSTVHEKQSTRTPTPLLDAFFPAPVTVGAITLRPLSLGDFILLEKLESPILEINATDDVEITVEDYAAAVFVLAAPFAKVAALVAKGPVARPEFDLAVLELASQIPAGELVVLGRKIRDSLAAGFATMQGMGSEKKTAAPTPASAGS